MTVPDGYRALTMLSKAELEKIFRASEGPKPESLAGYEYAGFNVLRLAKLLGIRKFIKGFYLTSRGVEGYNIPVKQNGIDNPWLHRPSAENPKRFGFYRVVPVDFASKDNKYPQALLLDYGAHPRNFRLAPERVLRDYLVCPNPRNPDILLGKAYAALAGLRVPASFFVLNRLRATKWRP